MGIWRIVIRNFMRASRTRLPNDMVPLPGGFRGKLDHDASRCTACTTCAYVCSPSAITFDESSPEFSVWQYNTGRCTFCAQCVHYCPTKSISLGSVIPDVSTDATRYNIAHAIYYQPCPRCGRLVIPMPEQALKQLYGGEIPEQARERQKLCERCRRKVMSTCIRDAIGGSAHE